MNAVQILLKDHQELRDFFKQFEDAGDRAYKTKQAITEKVIKELKAHSQLEEQYFYPAVFAKAGKEIKDLILEGIEEHRVADFLMAKLQSTHPEDETYAAKFKVLTESVQDHIKEEEHQLFPAARKLLDKELDSLGAQMEALEKKLEG